LIAIGKEKQPGGVCLTFLSMFIEVILSTIMAPVLAIMYAFFTLKILCGQGSGWNGQAREGQALPWWDTTLAYLPYVIIGSILPIIYGSLGSWPAVYSSGWFAVACVLAIPLAKLSSSPDEDGSGMKLKACGMFLSKYEDPPVPETELDAVEENLSAQMGKQRSTGSLPIGKSSRQLLDHAAEMDLVRIELDSTPIVIPSREQDAELSQQQARVSNYSWRGNIERQSNRTLQRSSIAQLSNERIVFTVPPNAE